MTAITKLIIISATGIIVCVLLAFLLIKPTINKVNSLNVELFGKKTEVKTLEQQILAFRSAQSDLSKVTQRDRVLNAIVESEDLVSAVKDIETAAKNTNSAHTLAIQDNEDPRLVTPPVIKGKKGVKEVPYTLTLKNDYEQIVKFMMYLEHLPHFTEISSFGAVAETSQSQEGQVSQQTGKASVTIEGVFFVKGEEVKAAPTKTNATQD
jgi:hypothetical protein